MDVVDVLVALVDVPVVLLVVLPLVAGLRCWQTQAEMGQNKNAKTL